MPPNSSLSKTLPNLFSYKSFFNSFVFGQAKKTQPIISLISHYCTTNMSDIAMLVAEEYERRVKNLKATAAVSDGGAVKTWEIDMSCFSLLVSKLKEEKKQLVRCLLEPKTQFAVAVSNSLFSA